MEIQKNISLKNYTTLHIGGEAKYFLVSKTLEEIKSGVAFAKENNLPIFVLGGGSNILVSDSGFDGLVIKNELKGEEIIKDNDDFVLWKISAGEILDEMIAKSVKRDWWGIENLSFVPGDVAGLAVQNVGAYGQEAKNIIEEVGVYDIEKNGELLIKNEECRFGYRKSIFNTTEKGRYIITSVILRLSKKGESNTSYGLKTGTLQEMRDQVIAIRKSKGQDPREYWSAGSFFKNPIITLKQFEALQERFGKEVPNFPSEGGTKIPAGFLLDKICNLKGLSVGGAKLSELQVINIINFNNATSEDVLNLYKKARDIVYEKTGITLVNEPEILG